MERAALLHHAGIVPAGKVGDAKARGRVCQRAKFDKGVARYAGAGRASGAVCLAKGLHHSALKRLARVCHVEGDGKLFCGLPRLFQRSFMCARKQNKKPLHGKPLLAKNVCRHGGIHPAGQRQQHAVLLFKGGKARCGAEFTAHKNKTPLFQWMRCYLNLAASATAMASQRSFSLWPAWPFTQW